jgi:hypothetical protein
VTDAAPSVPLLPLIEELAKKTSVCWLRLEGRTHAAWHAWHDGALCLVAGAGEQPLPGLADLAERGGQVEVVMRSKDNGGRLVAWVGEVRRVAPDDTAWEPVTAALVAGRLNLDDPAATPDRWAASATVVQVRPTGEAVEAPGTLPDDAHRAAPLPSPATTRGPLPRVLHRRAGTGRPLDG